MNSYNRKTNLIKQWTKDLIRHFSSDHIQMGNRRIKRCLPSVIIREVQIQTTMSCHLPPIKMVTTKNKTKSVGENMKKLEPLCSVGGIVKWCNWYGKQYSDSSKNKNGIAMLCSSLIYRYISKIIESSVLKRYLHTYVLCSIIHNSKEVEAIKIPNDG